MNVYYYNNCDLYLYCLGYAVVLPGCKIKSFALSAILDRLIGQEGKPTRAHYKQVSIVATNISVLAVDKRKQAAQPAFMQGLPALLTVWGLIEN